MQMLGGEGDITSRVTAVLPPDEGRSLWWLWLLPLLLAVALAAGGVGVRGQAALGALFLRLQLRLASGVALDYEGKRSNRFTVQVADGSGQDGAQDRQRR